MSPLLTALVALQKLDTAAEIARRRLAELPAKERQADDQVVAAETGERAADEAIAANHHNRRALEKDVSQVDSRLARFDEHKVAVKTNHEYTALLHEITTAKQEKDQLEEQILFLLEAADELAVKKLEAARVTAQARKEQSEIKETLAKERRQLDKELEGLAADRAREAGTVDAATLARYDQLLKQRRMVAVAAMDGELCSACHVRLRPNVTVLVRRNDGIVQCDSCQRILYMVPVEKPA
jgi:predicted  nucleic acid-binding Zn-ribbon protein